MLEIATIILIDIQYGKTDQLSAFVSLHIESFSVISDVKIVQIGLNNISQFFMIVLRK